MTTPLQRVGRGAIFLCLVVGVSVVGFRYLEGYDWIESLWLVVVTISTVGFGEHSTLSPTSQLLVVLLILLGMSAAVYTIGGFIQLMLEGEIENLLGKRRMDQEISRLSGHVLLCGYGRIGQSLAAELRTGGKEVVVLETNRDVQEEAVANGFLCVIGDATDESVLTEVGICRAGAIVTALPSDAENVFVTLTARNMNCDLQIIARAEMPSTEKKLLQAGANQVVMPSLVGARLMSRMITRPTTADLFDLVTHSGYEDLELDEISVTAGSNIIGATVAETEAHRKHKLLVVALKPKDGELLFNPGADQVFQQDDTAIVMGNAKDISRFRQVYGLA
ncbi:potassium channel family protein [Planctomycetes bacterium K23_9]|uniref:Voltage-gated potassium channel Kch n=1 Tax=Stieleria marina TaxID=1930275 RepID=A0A517NQW6_9BACT|nr:Voltage-gated potassium channel Kch [Planctomycetes bacterium K23_9]